MRRFYWVLAIAACLAALAYLYATEPSSAEIPNAGPVEECVDDCEPVPACPAGSQQNGPNLPAECVCPGGAVAAMIAADGTVVPVGACIDPAYQTDDWPEPRPLDPTEPVPFDDGDYPLDPPSGPVRARPGSTG